MEEAPWQRWQHREGFPSLDTPTSPRFGWGCATPLQVAAQQTPAIEPREEEEEEEGLWAVPDPNTSHQHATGFPVMPAAADTSLLIPSGRGWAHWGRDEKLSREEAGRKREKGE